MKAGSIYIHITHRGVAYTTNKVTTLHQHIDMRWNDEFDAATEGVYIDFLVLRDGGFAHIHPNATAESIKSSAMKRFATEDVFVAAKMHTAVDALAVLADGQWTLQPLVRVTTIAVDYSYSAYI